MARYGERRGDRKNQPSVDAKPPLNKTSGKASAKRSKPNDCRQPSKPRAQAPSPGLYIVATPIGNARDITLRALDVLAAADVIACEDTRVTSRLLAIHGITCSLVSYHEHNAEGARPRLMKRFKDGEIVALVSDAGTPLVSDPGYRLVAACIEASVPVTHVPGPSAVLSGLVLAGLPTDRFFFHGFLPTKRAARRKALKVVATVPSTIVFLESANRLVKALADMADVLGPRNSAVAREMTKFYEEVRRGPLTELAQHYATSGAPKGELTIVVEPPGSTPEPDAKSVDRYLSEALAKLSVREASVAVAAETGISRRRLYARALELKSRKY